MWCFKTGQTSSFLRTDEILVYLSFPKTAAAAATVHTCSSPTAFQCEWESECAKQLVLYIQTILLFLLLLYFRVFFFSLGDFKCKCEIKLKFTEKKKFPHLYEFSLNADFFFFFCTPATNITAATACDFTDLTAGSHYFDAKKKKDFIYG